MAFDRKEPSEFFEAEYGVLFHCSPYKGADQRWTCFPSDEKAQYFNGVSIISGSGRSAQEAYEDYKYKKDEQSRNSTE